MGISRGRLHPVVVEQPAERERTGGDHRQHGDGTMTAAIAFPRNAASTTFLTHFFGIGNLVDKAVKLGIPVQRCTA